MLELDEEPCFTPIIRDGRLNKRGESNDKIRTEIVNELELTTSLCALGR